MRLFVVFLALSVSALLSVNSALAQGWLPSEAQKNAAREMLSGYFLATDRGDWAAMHRYMAPSLARQTDPTEIAELHAENLARYGKVTKRVIQGVTWYGKGAQEGTGVAAAVDFHGQAEKAPIICGYVALVEMSPGDFAVVRDDTIWLAQRDIDGMPADVRARVLNRPGCRRFMKQ